MNSQELQVVVITSLTEVAPNVDTVALDPDQSFRDQFDFDSIDQLNFVLMLQKALNVEIPELDYLQLAGLRATVDYLTTKLANTE